MSSSKGKGSLEILRLSKFKDKTFLLTKVRFGKTVDFESCIPHVSMGRSAEKMGEVIKA